MNNKHLACFILFLVVVGCFQAAMMMHKKMAAARMEQEDAETALAATADQRRLTGILLRAKDQDTAALRTFLTRWLPKLEETNEETKARLLFTRVLKESGEGLVTFTFRTDLENIKDAAYITQRFRSSLAVEGDYPTAMGLIGHIERQMPSSRISTVNLSKGQRANDVKLSLTVDTPMIVQAKAEAKK